LSAEAVLLDAGGVLLLPNDREILRELTAVGVEVDPAKFARAHYKGMRGIDKGTSWADYNAAFLSELGVTADEAPAALNRAFVGMEWNVVIPESYAALGDVASRYAHVAVVSNSDGTVENLLRSTGIAQVGPGEGVEVLAIIDSSVVGIAKPDPAIFHHTLDLIGVEPSKAVHVGDSVRFDVEGARAAGVHPLHFDPYGVCDDDSHEHIARLAELLRV
jgi:putative hydrolase of the HAD superfamily